AVVLGTVAHSVISSGVRIGKGAKVTDSVVMPFAVIEEGAVVDHAILGPHTKVSAGAKVKGTPDAIAVTGENEVVNAAG
ncbi:MAG: glucose-1-phosphate adenylyltransferase, partial [Schwartzia sp.]|nr:glucose-1-phosphate adenylyltransferase [Schwartzia sp. (in: firmicutes)]